MHIQLPNYEEKKEKIQQMSYGENYKKVEVIIKDNITFYKINYTLVHIYTGGKKMHVSVLK